MDVEAVVDVAQDRGVNARGHTMSRTSSGQHSLIWLYMYHCLLRESQEGTTTGGRLCLVGAHVWSMSREMFSSSESDSTCTHCC